MSKKMLVNATHPEENRVAIVEDGILTELDIEVAGREPSKGNIYKAVVVRVETGLQAAFVDYGAERLGFLQIDEINFTTVKPDYKPADDVRRPRINDLLHRGQEILVQITKEERGTKGAALTTYLSLAGRYMVLMPGSQTRGVSRRAESDAQRKELKKAMSSLDLADGIGYIVRTAALDQTREELERDYLYLIRLYESIQELEQKSKAPALIYKESNLMIRSIRDYFTTDMDEVMIDDPQVFKEAKDFFQMVMPDQVKLVKLHQERRPIFSRYQIEEQIETLNHNKVNLPSGGSIVIDPTEALVAIDVNSGKMSSEQGVEATATKTNLEAATEVGRQLRLRDLGGLIVIDFIDMRDRKNMRLVENQVKNSLENDKARVNIGRISKFGLLELSRQRIKAALTQGSYLPCPHCHGSGHLKSPESQAVALLRKIHASAAKGQVSRIDARLPMEVAAYLLNNSREELVDMERRHQLQIHIHGNRDFLADQVEIEIQKKEKEKISPLEYVEAGTLPIPVAEIATAEENPPAEQETAEAETEPAKKRRRRRRRKPAASAATPEEAQTSEQGPAEDQVSALTADSTEGAEASGEATADKPEEAAAERQDVVATKPKRRRSRRKPRAANDTAQAGAVAGSAEQPPAEASQPAGKPAAEPSIEVKTPTATRPKPSRPRRTSKNPEAASQISDAKQENVAEQSSVAEKHEPLKPARRSRKQSHEGHTAKSDEAQAAQPADKTEEKPKRPRDSRAKPKPAKNETGKVAPAVAEANPAENQPVKKAPAKKAPARKTAIKDKGQNASPVKDKNTASPTQEKDKPKRSETVKKETAEADPASKS